MKQIIVLAALVGATALLGAGCDNDNSPTRSGDDGYNPVIDPADFAETIDNPYMPLTVGASRVYLSDDGSERVEVMVTDQTKEILGVTCIEVRDVVYVDEELVEDTRDWFAQDREDNVWYFGEDTKEYEAGTVISTEGSWEAGVDGAKPGIVMLGDPEVGASYRQEFYEDEAEDMAQVLTLDATVAISGSTYEHCLQTQEWTPLAPGVVEHKFYAPGVGLVVEETVEGGQGRSELAEITEPTAQPGKTLPGAAFEEPSLSVGVPVK